jgi:hypothetical protein
MHKNSPFVHISSFLCNISPLTRQISSGFMQRACKLAIRSVRIPAAWVMGHIVDGEEGMTIDAAWMARVKEIVDYCVKDGLYVLQAQKDY